VSAPVLSVVVLSWNTRALTLACLEALYRETPRHAREVVVVDNGSADGSADAVAQRFPAVRLVRNPDNRLYAAGNNQGAHAASGEFLCLLNSDTEVAPGALDTMVDFLRANPGHGAVAPMLVDPDGTVQRACQEFPTLMSTRSSASSRPAGGSRTATSCAASTTPPAGTWHSRPARAS